jgi:hypothetical protein
MPRRLGLALLLAAGFAAPTATQILAQGQSQVPAPRPAAKAPAPASAADPAFEAAKAAFEALPEAERKALQDALVWTGDYNSVLAGTFGRRTFEALNAFQARNGGGDPLSPPVRARILAAGEGARKAARFTVKADPASGTVLGVPERLLAKRSPLPGPLPAGTRWQSADGRVTLESRAFPPGAADLDGLFERATAPMPERRVTYKLKRPDFIVVTAETAGGRSYVRYAAGLAGVRGFTLGYDQALAGEVDRLVIAIANSFVPFPDAVAAPVAAVTPAAPALAPSPAARPPAATVRIAGTGLVVAPNRVLTAVSVLEGCAPRIGGAAARLVRGDPASGLALLEASGLPAPVPLAVRAEPVASEETLVVLAAGAEGVAVAPGTAGPGGLVAPLQPGAAGAPVLDRAGRLAGLVARYPAAPRLVAGVVPPLAVPLAAGAQLRNFLGENGVALRDTAVGGAASLGAVAGPIRPAVVAVTCAR